MLASRNFFLNLALCSALSLLTSACGGTDLGIKDAFVGKPMPTPDLPDRPGLVMPPANAPLPAPKIMSGPSRKMPSPPIIRISVYRGGNFRRRRQCHAAGCQQSKAIAIPGPCLYRLLCDLLAVYPVLAAPTKQTHGIGIMDLGAGKHWVDVLICIDRIAAPNAAELAPRRSIPLAFPTGAGSLPE